MKESAPKASKQTGHTSAPTLSGYHLTTKTERDKEQKKSLSLSVFVGKILIM
jgi:hypothetical protein